MFKRMKMFLTGIRGEEYMDLERQWNTEHSKGGKKKWA